MLFRTLTKLGYSKQEIIVRLNELGGITPESIATVIAENNDLILNRVNSVIQGNNEEIRNALEK